MRLRLRTFRRAITGSYLAWLLLLVAAHYAYSPELRARRRSASSVTNVAADVPAAPSAPFATEEAERRRARSSGSEAVCPVPRDPDTGFPLLSFLDPETREEPPQDLQAYIRGRIEKGGCIENEGRSFDRDPVLIWTSYPTDTKYIPCDVPCAYTHDAAAAAVADAKKGRAPDRLSRDWDKECEAQLNVVQSMESPETYPQASVAGYRDAGWDVLSSLERGSDVPFPYVSWWDYSIFDAPKPKGAEAMAAFFVSNCAPERLRVIEELEAAGVSMHSFGGCKRNREIPEEARQRAKGSRITEKVITLSAYKFYLAFENTRVTDYVTEKLYEGYTAGTVPLYLGAPNWRDYA
eukprot:tig00000857_g4923.t1